MAKEINAFGLTAGTTYKAVILNAADNYWTGIGNNFAAASAITWSAAGVTMTPDPTITRDFTGDFPTDITSAGRYTVIIYSQAGGTFVVGDVQGTPAAIGEIDWGGTAEVAPPSTAGMLLSSARALLRQFARNAQSSALYSDSDSDRSIQIVCDQFCRNTKSITKINTGTTGAGVPAGGSFVLSEPGLVVMPEQVISMGTATEREPLAIINNADLLRKQVDDPSTGIVKFASIDSTLQAIGSGSGFTVNLYPYSPAIAQIQTKIWLNFTSWTVGVDDAAAQLIALNIPEPWLRRILRTGAAAQLQLHEPENQAWAQNLWAMYEKLELSFVNAGSLRVATGRKSMQI